MVKMSDIFKKIKGKRAEEKPSAETIPKEQKTQEPTLPPSPYETTKQITPFADISQETLKETSKTSDISISSVIMKETRVITLEDCTRVYEETLSLLKETMQENIDYERINGQIINAQVEKIANILKINSEIMLDLSLVKNPETEDYLFYHSMNVCIISLIIGLVLNYNSNNLAELGASALLHDIGMIKHLFLVNQPRKLTTSEHNVMKTHAVTGAKMLEKIVGLPKSVIIVAEQHHERLDGSGYPKGLQNDDISEYSKIVSVVDIYEAMMHARRYRETFRAVDTIQEIINQKKALDYKVIKILIEKIGIFPVGCLVELSTREIARVIKLNYQVFLRPVVRIIYDSNGEKLIEEKLLDLATESAIYIKRGMESGKYE